MVPACRYCEAPVPAGRRVYCCALCADRDWAERQHAARSARVQQDRAQVRPCVRGCGGTVPASFAPTGGRPSVCADCQETHLRAARATRYQRSLDPRAPLEGADAAVLAAVRAGARTPPAVVAVRSVSLATTYAALCTLAARGLVRRVARGRYEPAGGAP